MAKNFDQIACIFCGATNLKGDASCVSCRKPLHIQRSLEGQKVNNLTLLQFRARGFYGLTFKAEDDRSKPFAVKLISQAAYKAHSKDFQEEAEAYADLPDHPCIARYVSTGENKLLLGKDEVAFYYIVSEWIDGPPLKDWITSNELTPSSAYSMAVDLLTAISAFEEKNLWHNDLHEENILVTVLSESQRRGLRRDRKEIFKIVDIGSARFRAEANLGDICDLAYVGRHLAQVWKRLSARHYLFSKEDQEFIGRLESICGRLTDEDPSRGFKSSEEALNSIQDAWEQSRLWMPETSEKLTDPYGLINAMDIKSPKLIRDMFSHEFKYFDRIKSIDNHCIIITGPRGCGKTMILKRMSFETELISGPNESIAKLGYIGLYISARTEFGNYLVAIRQPKWINESDKIGMYFNCLVTMKAIDILYQLVNLRIEDVRSVQPVIDFVTQRFDLPPCDLFSCRNYIVDKTKAIVLEEEKESIKTNALNATPAYIDDFVEYLTGTIRSMRGKEIVLLVDDLSWPRIPVTTMKILAPFLFNPGSKYKTRVSAHSNGLVTIDMAGEEYKSNRDYTEINLGREYFFLSEEYDLCKQAFNDLMERRFRLAEKPAFSGIETVLGRGDDLRDLGAVIKELARQRKLRSLRYHGSYVFVKLCSGDLSYLVEILGLMSTRWGESPYPISNDVQSDVIKNYAKTQLMLLQDVKTEGVTSLYEAGMTFGMISKAKLMQSGKEHLRIEIKLSDLDDELKGAIRELLSSGVFIDGGYSSASSGVPARRLLFRRIYTPAFPTTVNNRETLPMAKKGFRKFIREPKEFRQTFLSKHGISPTIRQQLEMFDD